MKIENQVCTPKQGEKLKELGILQESAFWHWGDYDGYGAKGPRQEKWNNGRKHTCSAYSVAELGVMLPEQCSSWWWDSEDGMRWDAVGDENNHAGHMIEYKPTEAEARACLLIFLLENKLITVAEINDRLQKAAA